LLSCGDTFLIPKSGRQTEHLWIVVTDPEPETDLAVCVSITTRRSNSDTTVIILPGMHPFIRHDSVVYYSDAKILDLNKVQQALDARMAGIVCERRESCSQQLVEMVRQGILSSKMTPNKVKDYCRKAWGLNP
jgi:hypothetical protein